MLVSQVYEGVDQRSDERVAIKAMNRHEIDDNPRLVTLLEREINISLKLTHTGVTVMHAILNHVSVFGSLPARVQLSERVANDRRSSIARCRFRTCHRLPHPGTRGWWRLALLPTIWPTKLRRVF